MRLLTAGSLVRVQLEEPEKALRQSLVLFCLRIFSNAFRYLMSGAYLTENRHLLKKQKVSILFLEEKFLWLRLSRRIGQCS